MAEPNLELLMQLMQSVLDSQRETREDIREIKTRLGRLESDLARNIQDRLGFRNRVGLSFTRTTLLARLGRWHVNHDPSFGSRMGICCKGG